jgi:hypothetical protein
MTSSRLAEARLSPNHIRFDAVMASDEMMPSSALMRPSRRRGCYGRCTGSWPMSSRAWGAGSSHVLELGLVLRPHIPDTISHGITQLMRGQLPNTQPR